MDTKERFFQYVDKTNSCWLWTGATSSGKGKARRAMFFFRGTTTHASRVAWIILIGDPKQSLVLHTCDNDLCVNPDHLYLGTYGDNLRDRLIRYPESVVRGSAHGQSKLTELQVKEIREKYIPYSYSQYRLAKEYGVARTTIQQLLEGRSWILP